MEIKPAIINDFANGGQPEYTGRYLVSIREGAGIKEIRKFSTDLHVESSEDLDGPAANFATLDAMVQGSGGVLLKNLGVAIIKGEPQQLNVLSATADTNSPFLNFEPERVVYPIGDLSAEYLKGYRDAVNHLYEKTLDGAQEKMAAETIVPLSTATWGLQVTNVIRSKFSGRGVNVAVLDTGFFHDHPDFKGRTVVSKSFIEHETPEDVHGHGSHCVGTAMGPLNPLTGPRYGVAYNANIFVGKVLSNAGRGTDGSILAGIEWAVSNKCRIVSMSLGAPTRVGQRYSSIYEAAAARAMAAAALIIAAAGNNSSRVKAPVNIASVAHPANCPSVMAVAAVDATMGIAEFSCAGLNLEGGQVDISGPGVDVYSAWVPPSKYRTISGTSMATPHVAGIAALLAEANPNASASDLWLMLTKNARRLSLPSTDIGSGLVFLPA